MIESGATLGKKGSTGGRLFVDFICSDPAILGVLSFRVSFSAVGCLDFCGRATSAPDSWGYFGCASDVRLRSLCAILSLLEQRGARGNRGEMAGQFSCVGSAEVPLSPYSMSKSPPLGMVAGKQSHEYCTSESRYRTRIAVADHRG